ncbi:MAG TPA: hypothetical protein VF742_17050 [Terracidiphilus sp.]
MGTQPTAGYIAKHSTGAKIVTVCLVIGLGLLIGFFFYHPRLLHIWMWCALGVLFCMNCVYAYRICMTTMRFESDRVSFQIAPFISSSELYRDITKIRAKQGALELQFADGKTMSRWSGLGDSGRITEILMQKTDILPS